MVQRALPALLATMLLATSGVAGAALHLCGMEGLVRSRCCCHKSDDGAPPLQLKRIDECCGTVLSGGQHPPVNADAGKLTIDTPFAVAAIASAPADCVSAAQVSRFARARGSPPTHGPPLFIQHCSLLN